MREAVSAVVKAKTLSFQAAESNGAWINPAVAKDVPALSDAAVAATTAYCEYVWNRYGRFPAYLAPFRTVVGYQACHLDLEFYDKFYRPEALTRTQREDFARFHA
jgi:hypothetical protein